MKLQAVWGGRILLHNYKKSWQLTSLLLVGCNEHLYLLDAIRIQCHILLCDGVLMLFWYLVTENIVSQIFLDSKAVLHIREQRCPLCVLTCTFLPQLSCCSRRYQLIHTSVLDGWFQIFLVPVTCWISSDTLFALSQNYWFGKIFWQKTHAPPCCMPSYTVYLAANSWHSCIHWYHLLLFTLAIP